MNQQFTWTLENCNRKRNTFCEVDLCRNDLPYCFFENLEIRGTNIGSATKVQDRLECRQKCWDTAGCIAYTYYARRSNFKPGYSCHLYSSIVSVNLLDVKARATSAPRNCDEIRFLICSTPNVKIDGNVLDVVENVSSFSECQEKCKGYRSCVAVTYYQSGSKYHPARSCEIFDVFFGARKFDGAVSRQRDCDARPPGRGRTYSL